MSIFQMIQLKTGLVLGIKAGTFGIMAVSPPGNPATDTARRTAPPCSARIVSVTAPPKDVPQMSGWLSPSALMRSTVDAAMDWTVSGAGSLSIERPWPRLSKI